MSQAEPERPLCRRCGKPILKGEPCWKGDPDGRPWHYRCAEDAHLTVPCRPAPVAPPVRRS